MIFKILLSLIIPLGAWAQIANLPDTASSMDIGRLKVFMGPQPIVWLRPTAFSTLIKCTPENTSGDQRTCTIQIINRMTTSEEQQLEQLQKTVGPKLISFNDVHTQVVQNIKETFELLPKDIQGAEIVSQTLQMSEGPFPYASVMFRAPKPRIAELLNDFSQSGLGTFRVDFTLRTQTTLSYIGLKDGDCLKQDLLALDGKSISKKNLIRSLEKITDACELQTIDYTTDQARTLVVNYLKDQFFKYNWGYNLKTELVKTIGTDWKAEHLLSPVESWNCSSVLSLSLSSDLKTECKNNQGDIL